MSFADFWRILSAVSDLEAWLAIFLIILLGYLMSPKSKKHKLAWLMFVLLPTIIILAALVEVLKISTQIPRPCIGTEDCPDGYSFPSRHATVMFALATVVGLNARNLNIKLLFFVLAILVSLSRVMLYYHTYFDITGGAILGISIAYLVNAIYKRRA